jgi:hypothetical protein
VVLASRARYDDVIEVNHNILRTVSNHPMALLGLINAFYAKGICEEALEAARTFSSLLMSDHEAVEGSERGHSEGGFRE